MITESGAVVASAREIAYHNRMAIFCHDSDQAAAKISRDEKLEF